LSYFFEPPTSLRIDRSTFERPFDRHRAGLGERRHGVAGGEAYRRASGSGPFARAWQM